MHPSFDSLNLTTPLLNALENAGYIYPTPIQLKSFPIVMSGKDLIGIAQTGTGKTLAYILPLLRQLKYSEQKHPRILIVVPVRELVSQVVDELAKFSGFMNFRFAGVYGGTNINTQVKLIYEGLDILVGTPGRLLDLAMTGNLRLKSVQKFVIDEVDEMFKQGFRHQVNSIMEILPQKRQNLMFSATLTPEVDAFIKDFFSDPVKIELTPHGTGVEKINQMVFYVPNFYTKLNLLQYLLTENNDMNKVLVFANSKKRVDMIFSQFENKFQGSIGVIHSNKAQNTRFKVLENFEKGNFRILLTTDILARGLDITDVSHVINFDIPEAPGDYIHRIGRTGRVDKTGTAISFIRENEKQDFSAIEKMMKINIVVNPLPESLEISNLSTDDEKTDPGNKDYLKPVKLKNSGGAFHEKKEKNKKTNSGSPAKKGKKNSRTLK